MDSHRTSKDSQKFVRHFFEVLFAVPGLQMRDIEY